MGTLLATCKTFYYSTKKAEKLAEIQDVLNAPETEFRMVKPMASDKMLAVTREGSMHCLSKRTCIDDHCLGSIQ